MLRKQLSLTLTSSELRLFRVMTFRLLPCMEQALTSAMESLDGSEVDREIGLH